MADFITTDDSFDHSFIAGSVYYWQYYGLNQSPFEEASDFAMYYSTPSLQEHLNYLRSFCSGEQPLLLIQGELGAGKTTLISQLISQLDENIVHYQIKARETITAAEFANQIALGFQLPIALDQPTLRERLDTELQALALQQKTGVLVIEDADLLPIESWVALTHLALAQLGQPISLYMILTSESRLENQIQQFALEQGQSFRVPTLQLMPLSFQETQNYVKHRLIKSGLSEKVPFTKEMMQRIYDLSDGIPGRINRVAQQMLIEMLKPDAERLPVAQNQRSWARSFWNGHAIKFMSGIMLAVVLVAVVRFYGNENFLRPLHANTNQQAPAIIHNKVTENNSVATINRQQALAAQTNVSAANNNVESATVSNASATAVANAIQPNVNASSVTNPASAITTTNAVAKNTPVIPANTAVTTLTATPKGPSTALTIPPESAASNNVAANVAAINTASVPAHASTTSGTGNSMAANSPTNPALVAANTNSASATPATSVGQDASIKTETQVQPSRLSSITVNKAEPKHHAVGAAKISASEQALMKMQGYTLQIIGARDAAVLQQVLKQTGLSNLKAHEFRTNFGDKPWYVLVYGNYASSAEAKAAIKKLPAAAQHLEPWIRPLHSVHSAIQQYR